MNWFVIRQKVEGSKFWITEDARNEQDARERAQRHALQGYHAHVLQRVCTMSTEVNIREDAADMG